MVVLKRGGGKLIRLHCREELSEESKAVEESLCGERGLQVDAILTMEVLRGEKSGVIVDCPSLQTGIEGCRRLFP